ncbi:YeiH family protein [Segnochrobactraceae bacterium EtOH-i3]
MDALRALPVRNWTSELVALVPGLALVAGVGVVAQAATHLPGLGLFSPMILAILLGMALRAVWTPPAVFGPGVRFAVRPLLRLAIVLLGARLTLGQMAAVGAGGLATIVVAMGGTFLFTIAVGKLLRVDTKLAELIAAGTSICGASAVIAAASVTRADEEDIAYAVATVTVFGTLAMLLYPLLAAPFGLTPEGFGLWSGASIHEIAQVVGAAYQGGPVALETGTVAKLARILLLAPMLMGLGLAVRHRADATAGAVPVLPWFVLGFILMVGVNSFGLIPEPVRLGMVDSTGLLLTLALAAMGLGTDARRIAARGARPLLLAALAFLFIAGVALLLVHLTA